MKEEGYNYLVQPRQRIEDDTIWREGQFPTLISLRVLKIYIESKQEDENNVTDEERSWILLTQPYLFFLLIQSSVGVNLLMDMVRILCSQ